MTSAAALDTKRNHHLPVELLAPAGNFEKLEIAVHYGADAVYLAGKSFSLRQYSGNFTLAEMAEAVDFAHRHGVNVYVACNAFGRNREQAAIADFLVSIAQLGADAVIIADPGTYLQARRVVPDLPVHLSTQANTTNFNSVLFWQQQGVRRVNIAREVSLAEIHDIATRCQIEIEAFVHGAMCISISGRCLLSSFLTGRASNRGACTHPCRWRYAVMEETRPGIFLPIEEDGAGTYLFNAKDLCMVTHLPAMIDAGITSLKIEGRMKGIHYLATTVNVYRRAIDAYMARPLDFRVDPQWLRELNQINHRGYSSGFYLEDPMAIDANRSNLRTSPGVQLAAKVLADMDDHRSKVEIRNKVTVQDQVEILQRGRRTVRDRIMAMFAADGRPLDIAQPGSCAVLQMSRAYPKNALIRRIIDSQAVPIE